MHINFRSWERNVPQSLLHLLGPLLHQIVDVWHLLGVVYGGRWASFMQVLHAVDPARNLLRLLIRVLYRFNVHWSGADDVSLLDVAELYDSLVLRV